MSKSVCFHPAETLSLFTFIKETQTYEFAATCLCLFSFDFLNMHIGTDGHRERFNPF